MIFHCKFTKTVTLVCCIFVTIHAAKNVMHPMFPLHTSFARLDIKALMAICLFGIAFNSCVLHLPNLPSSDVSNMELGSQVFIHSLPVTCVQLCVLCSNIWPESQRLCINMLSVWVFAGHLHIVVPFHCDILKVLHLCNSLTVPLYCLDICCNNTVFNWPQWQS